MDRKIKKFDIVLFLIPFIMFGIALLIYYPGILSFDSYNQLEQIRTGIYSNGHPFIHTLIEMGCLKVFNSPFSIAIFQILVFSFIWSMICKYNRKNDSRCEKILQVILTVLVCINPINSIMSITLWKDVLYSYIVLLICFVLEIFVDKHFELNIKNLVAMAFLLIFASNIRHNGLIITYFLGALLVVILIIKNFKKLHWLYFSIFLVAFNYIFMIPFAIFDVKKETSSSSVLDSKVIQLSGAYLVNDKFSPDELKILNKYVNIVKLRENYNPFFMDKVSGQSEINSSKLNESRSELYFMILNKSIKEPGVFIDFELKNTTALFGIYRPTGCIGTILNTSIVAENQDSSIYHINENSFVYKVSNDYVYGIMSNPFLCVLMYSSGFYFWISIAMCIYFCLRKIRGSFLIILPNLLNVMGLVLTIPVQDVRYVYPNFLVVYLLGLIFISRVLIRKCDNCVPTASDKKKKKTLLIIPAYNEEANILKTYKSVVNYNKKNGTDYDVIVINDGSKDSTEEILVENDIPHIHLVHNLGIGGAVQTGYKYAYENDYDIAVQFDGDGQHDVRYVKKIIDPIIKGQADMVIGSRFVENIDTFKSSKSRRLGIKVISVFMEFVTGINIYDTTSGFRACSRELIYDFSLSYPSEYPEPITTAEVLKKKYVVEEVSVEMNEREGGVSSIRAWKSVYYMLNVCLALLAIKVRRYKRCR